MGEENKLVINVELTGSTEKIDETIEGIGKFTNVQILPRPFPGGWPFPIMEMIDASWVAKFKQRALPRIIKDIYGGIRSPHIHVDGEVVMLARKDFLEVTNQIADRLITDLVQNVEYDRVVDKVSTLMIDTVPLPERRMK